MTPTPPAAAWLLRYAPHLGVASPEQPLFRFLAGASDPVSQIRWAATQGFAGAQYPWAVSRPQIERDSVAAALRDTNLAAGVVVWSTRQVYRQPLWGISGASAWEKIAEELQRATRAATCIGASIVGVVNTADSTRDIEAQRRAMADHLLRAADLLAERGLTIGLEPMLIVPNMLLKTLDDGMRMLERLRHPGVRLIFDTAHVKDGGDDVVEALRASYDKLCLIQLADHPGRLEPGTGSIDFQSILYELLRNDYRGLVELEHFWSAAGPETERAGLKRLHELERAAAEQLRVAATTART